MAKSSSSSESGTSSGSGTSSSGSGTSSSGSGSSMTSAETTSSSSGAGSSVGAGVDVVAVAAAAAQPKVRRDKGKEEVSDSGDGYGAHSDGDGDSDEESSSVILLEDSDEDGMFSSDGGVGGGGADGFVLTPVAGSGTTAAGPGALGSGRVAVLTPEQIVELAMSDIAAVVNTLAIPAGLALSALSSLGWSRERLLSSWFEDQERVLERAGATVELTLTAPLTSVVDGDLCGVCFMPAEGPLEGLDCGHGFCIDCWRGFLKVEITSGTACVEATCMASGCALQIDRGFVARIVDPELLARYDKFLAGAYIARHPSAKVCPNPQGGCERAAFYSGFETVAVDCGCGFSWCFFCSEELHLPASCEIVEQWNAKNSSAAESTSWIVANTKPCPNPKCKVSIQKNQGCMHMKCYICSHEFCWLCRGPWKEHGTTTGGFYKCNRYEKSAAAKEDLKANTIKEAHDRYLHYFERYHNHDVSRGFARKISAKANEAADGYRVTTGWNGSFLVEAAELVIHARQVLKWSYAFGYFMADDAPVRTVFEDQQKSLEIKTEHLSELIEQPIESMNVAHLKNFTKVLANYLGNLVAAWQEYQQ